MAATFAPAGNSNDYCAGYGVGYTTPQEVSQQGVTVATLHQGIGGIHNATDGTPSMVIGYAVGAHTCPFFVYLTDRIPAV